MKWWDQMPWSLFSECWALSQLFHSPPSLSSQGSLAPLHFLPWGGLEWVKMLKSYFHYMFLVHACSVASLMSDCLWPCGSYPARLLCPWDSPGKNIGVGCHFLLQCMKVKSEGEVAQSCPTLSDPMDCSLPGFSIHGIFQARVLEWGAIAFSGIWIYTLLYTCYVTSKNVFILSETLFCYLWIFHMVLYRVKSVLILFSSLLFTFHT